MSGFGRALKLIDGHRIGYPKEFARLMWPDGAGWQRVGKCGNGSHRGVGMYLAAGGLLGKLRQRGWVSGGSCGREAMLTPEGRKRLVEAGEELETCGELDIANGQDVPE